MRTNKLIAFFFILIGFLVLSYKRNGFYNWGGYANKTFENMIISSVLIIIGLIFMKKSKNTN